MKTIKRIAGMILVLSIAAAIWYLVFTGQVMNAEEAYETAKSYIR